MHSSTTMVIIKETSASLRRVMWPLYSAHILHSEMKPAVLVYLQSILKASYCVHPANYCKRTFLQNNSRKCPFKHKGNNVMETAQRDHILYLLSDYPLFPQGSNFSQISILKRFYHSRSKLSVEEDVFTLYLQSLASELKVIKEKQSKGDNTFGTEKEEKIHLARHHFLTGANEVTSRIFEKKSEISELKSLTSDEKDSEMKQMIRKEVETLGQAIQQLEDELIEVLAGDEPADSNDVILEVSAGVGGQEAMLFCAEVFNMYCQYSHGKGWSVTLIDKDEIGLGGFRKASVEINGFNVYRWLKYEAGVHRVQRVPKTEKAGRVHTSTVSVSVLPQPREIDIQIEKKDLKIETFRNSGPGGQSVNTTDSAVRITHLPTGTVSECKQERSQIKNKEKAMKVLKMKLYQAHLEEEEANRRATRKMQIGSRGRSEKIRTYNFQQDRVTDHRVKENYSNLPDFLAGGEGLEDLITILEKDFKCKVVESMVDEFEFSLKNNRGK